MVEKTNGSTVVYGWVCPLCGIALAPFVRSCDCASSTKEVLPYGPIKRDKPFDPERDLKPGIWYWPYVPPVTWGDSPDYRGPIS